MGFFGGGKKKAAKEAAEAAAAGTDSSGTQRKSRKIAVPNAKPGAAPKTDSSRQVNVQKRDRPPSQPAPAQAAAPARPAPAAPAKPAAAPAKPATVAATRTEAVKPAARVQPALADDVGLEPMIAPGKTAAAKPTKPTGASQPTTIEFSPGSTPAVGREDGKKPIDLGATPDLDFAGGLGGDRGAFSRKGDRNLREFLVSKAKLIDATQADQAGSVAQKDNVPFDVACSRLGFITEDQLVNALTQECWVPHLKVDKYEIRKKALDTVAEKDARFYSVLPVDKLGSILNLAMVNPLDVDAIQDLETRTGLDIKKVVATRSEIEAGIARYYGGVSTAKEGSLEIAQDHESRRVTQMLSRSAGGPAIQPEGARPAPAAATPSASSAAMKAKTEPVTPPVQAPNKLITADLSPSSNPLPDIADIDDLLAGDADVAPAIIEAITIADDEVEPDLDEPELVEELEIASELQAADLTPNKGDALEPVISRSEPIVAKAPPAPLAPQPAPLRPPSLLDQARSTPSEPIHASPAKPAPQPAATSATRREVPSAPSAAHTTKRRSRERQPDFLPLTPVMEEDFQHAITHGKSRIFEKWVSLQTRNRILNAVVVEGELDGVLASLYAHGERVES